MATDALTAPQGTFQLDRLHDDPGSPLRAWDAADEYLLDHLAGREEQDDAALGSVAVVNDAHGALTVSLAGRQLAVISDSYVSRLATLANLERNERSSAGISFGSTVDAPSAPIDTLVVKVPKSLALLEHQLTVLRPFLTPAAVVVGAGMTRHIHTSTIETFERVIGPTTTSLARRKARLLHAAPEGRADLPDTTGPDPGRWPRFTLPSGPTVVSGPGVFAGAKLDVGTRILLDHLADRSLSSEALDVIDLGCGSGVLGTSVAQRDPRARVTFVDESHLAVASAGATVDASAGDEDLTERCRFLIGDALDTIDPADEPNPIIDGSADLVLVNPPFHDDHAIGDATAWRMFTGARRVLRPGGEILVVGNRHLGYHAKVKRMFGNADVVASNPKFVVISATC